MEINTVCSQILNKAQISFFFLMRKSRPLQVYMTFDTVILKTSTCGEDL